MNELQWRKSSYSDNGGNCVEAADRNGVVLVRDTTNREDGTLTVSVSAWTTFVASVKASLGSLPPSP